MRYAIGSQSQAWGPGCSRPPMASAFWSLSFIYPWHGRMQIVSYASSDREEG